MVPISSSIGPAVSDHNERVLFLLLVVALAGYGLAGFGISLHTVQESIGTPTGLVVTNMNGGESISASDTGNSLSAGFPLSPMLDDSNIQNMQRGVEYPFMLIGNPIFVTYHGTDSDGYLLFGLRDATSRLDPMQVSLLADTSQTIYVNGQYVTVYAAGTTFAGYAGASVTTPQQLNSPQQPKCVDSDARDPLAEQPELLSLSLPGRVFHPLPFSFEVKESADYCKDKATIVEGICSNDRYAAVVRTCGQGGCKNGACRGIPRLVTAHAVLSTADDATGNDVGGYEDEDTESGSKGLFTEQNSVQRDALTQSLLKGAGPLSGSVCTDPQTGEKRPVGATRPFGSAGHLYCADGDWLFSRQKGVCSHDFECSSQRCFKERCVPFGESGFVTSLRLAIWRLFS